MTFIEKLRDRWNDVNSLVCVGLDPEPSKFPAKFADDPEAMFGFCRDIVDATAEYVCCFKPQIAYFAARSAEGALERLIAHIHDTRPGIPVILDAKRGDMGTTAAQYALEAFSRYKADAVTLNPYQGIDAAQPFLDHAERGCVFLCHTSNPGAKDFQELPVPDGAGGTRPLYQHVAATIANRWNTNGNCLLVVGATFPAELREIRALVGDMPLLIPGAGAQGGDVAEVMKHGATADGTGLVISSSRAILYASRGDDYAAAAASAARALRDEINRQR
jgi:orotidine-5'-phosphate decarboxylase